MKKFSVVCNVCDGGAYVVSVEAKSAEEAKSKVWRSAKFNDHFDSVLCVFEGEPVLKSEHYSGCFVGV